MIKRIIQFGSATIVSLSFVGGMALAAPSISNTGKNSVNVAAAVNVNACKSISKQNVVVGNANVQLGKSGKATVKGNTTASGNATSGGVTNGNAGSVTVGAPAPATTDCSASGTGTPCQDGTIDTTGEHSTNVAVCANVSLQKTVTVSNVFIGNLSVQGCKTGSATVSGNTNGGSATSGNCSNTNTTTITIGSSS